MLRTSYRVNGKVCHTTIANLSHHCTDQEIDAMKLALKHKDHLQQLTTSPSAIHTKQTLSVGAVWALFQLAKRMGLYQALGTSQDAKLVLWMVFATVIEQGSRLSAVRLARQHAVCDILGLESFTEDDLYLAMNGVAARQARIENTLLKKRYPTIKPTLYLYDVTSSYFEGDKNELADYGYNRDRKTGKKQIVIGLMTDTEGWPITIEVFRGNTHDMKTFKSQIEKVAKRFGVEQITFVGDRGMIKQSQIHDLSDEDFHYITAITKPEIETLLTNGPFNLTLFDTELAEVIEGDVRYILRRNPLRQKELSDHRDDNVKSLQRLVDKEMGYLNDHPRARVTTSVKKITAKIAKLKLKKWLTVTSDNRRLHLVTDEQQKIKATQLDGCYVIKTDVPKTSASAETIHSRYKGLSEVEWAFRTMKTTLLEMRGIFVRNENRTRAHVFIIMLAYMLAYQLRRMWKEVDVTVEEGMKELASISGIDLEIAGQTMAQRIPEPREQAKLLLAKANIILPEAIPSRHIKVDTRKKLPSERKSHMS